jgi:hypothetical protein
MSEQKDMFEAKAMVVKEEEKSELEVMPVNLVEAFIEEADKRVRCINKMKSIIFKVTNIGDWTDQGGKPYLRAEGAEAIATALHIEWDKPSLEITESDNGHKTFEYSGYFYFLGRKVWIMGARGSNDPFFAKAGGSDRPIETINMANVKKAAYTNLLNNGIKRILGIRNMTWELLEEHYGMKKSQATKVDYSAKVISPAQAKRLFAIGKSAGWSDEAMSEYLAECEYSSSKDILKKDYEAICNHVEKNPKN